MKKSLLPLAVGIAFFGIGAGSAAAVTYVQLCSNVIADPGFYYIPGFERSVANGPYVCINPVTGETRQSIPITATTSVTWKSLLPYPNGVWVSTPQQACGSGRRFKVGTFKSTDFALNAFHKLQTYPSTLQLKATEFISKVVMSGGFYDPRTPIRAGSNGSFLAGGPGLCVRSIDQGNGGLPVGCVDDQRIVNMPLAYAVSANSAAPNIDGHFVYGIIPPPATDPNVFKPLVVTTDIGPGGPAELRYCDATAGSCAGGVYDPTSRTYSPLGPGLKPMSGTLSVWACVIDSSNSQSNPGR